MKVNCNDEGIRKSVEIIENGGVIIFPTDTVYGIGCNPYDPNAVKKIYEINGFLIGAASQNSKKFIDIINKTIN